MGEPNTLIHEPAGTARLEVLEQAGIVFDAMAGTEGLRVVAAELKTVTLHDTVQHDQDMPAQRPESLF